MDYEYMWDQLKSRIQESKSKNQEWYNNSKELIAKNQLSLVEYNTINKVLKEIEVEMSELEKGVSDGSN